MKPDCAGTIVLDEHQRPSGPPILISGAVMTTTCNVLAGKVDVFISPDLSVSDAQDVVAAASADVGPDGKFTIVADPSAPPFAGAVANAYANDGWINFELVVYGSDGSLGINNFARFVQQGKWYEGSHDLPVSPVPVTVEASTTPKSAADVRLPSSIAGDRPSGGFGCGQRTQTIGRTTGWMKIGELHTGTDHRARFTYGESADSDVGVGVSADGVHWHISASVHIGNSRGGEDLWPMEGQEFGRVLKGGFEYVKTYNYTYGAPWCNRVWYETKATRWIGGMRYGSDIHGLDHHCRDTYNQYHRPYLPGAGFRRYDNQFKTWGAAVSVFGVTLSAKSGASSNTQSQWWFGNIYQTYYLCGNDDFPRFAHRIFAGA